MVKLTELRNTYRATKGEATAVLLSGDPELLQEFIRDADLGLTACQAQMLEADVNPKSVAAELLRRIHTIKGDASFLHLAQVRDVAHETETLLDEIVKGHVETTDLLVAVLNQALKVLKGLVSSVGAALSGDHLLAAEPKVPLMIDAIRQVLVEGAVAILPEVVETKQPDSSHDLVKRLKSLSSSFEWEVSRLDPADRLRDLVRELATIATEFTSLSDTPQKTPVMKLLDRAKLVAEGAAKELGKEINVVIEAADIEIPTRIAAQLTPVLTHLVRNAVDHGIEIPATRRADGKLPEGLITIAAKAQGNGVEIAVSDDGQGLIMDNVLARAKLLGLAEQKATEIDPEVVFQPGFSTRDTVGRYSGRGVGLDVVQHTASKLHGTARIEQRKRGLCVTLWVPLES